MCHDIERIKIKRSRADAALLLIFNDLQKHEAKYFGIVDLQVRLKKLEEAYVSFDSADSELPLQMSDMEEFENKYFAIRAKLEKYLEDSVTNSTSVGEVSETNNEHNDSAKESLNTPASETPFQNVSQENLPLFANELSPTGSNKFSPLSSFLTAPSALGQKVETRKPDGTFSPPPSAAELNFPSKGRRYPISDFGDTEIDCTNAVTDLRSNPKRNDVISSEKRKPCAPRVLKSKTVAINSTCGFSVSGKLPDELSDSDATQDINMSNGNVDDELQYSCEKENIFSPEFDLPSCVFQIRKSLQTPFGKFQTENPSSTTVVMETQVNFDSSISSKCFPAFPGPSTVKNDALRVGGRRRNSSLLPHLKVPTIRPAIQEISSTLALIFQHLGYPNQHVGFPKYLVLPSRKLSILQPRAAAFAPDIT